MGASSRNISAACLVLLAAVSMPVVLRADTSSSGSAQGSRWLSAMQWRSVGPWIGGRVVAVAGVPNRNLFYMGAVDGGVWKSTNYGITWQNITDGTLPSASNSIGVLAVVPGNPNIIYAGMGESDIRADVITGDGVYKSTDGGKTWSYSGLLDTHTISAIVIDPKDPAVVYAASMGHVFAPNPDRGVFKSVDSGKTWRKVLFTNNDTGAIGLAIDPKRPSVLYATMWQAYRTPWKLSSGGPGSGLYKTTDGGAHWVNLSHTPGFPQGVLGKMGVAVSASTPRIVYLIAQAKDGGVFRSADGGASWAHVNNDWKLRQRAFYYMAIFVDPTNPDTVYAPNVDALWVSHDGGKAWTKLRPPHGDNHIVWIDPSNPRVLLEGNDGGATVSTDGGETWSDEHNQPTGQFYHVGLDNQFPFHIYGAQQDEGSYEGPSATSDGNIPLSNWRGVAFGESTFVAPQPNNPNITYGSGYFSILVKHDLSNEQNQSISPWPHFQAGASSTELKYRFGWTHPILFSPVNPKELLVGSQYVLTSQDYGQSWQRISPDLTRNDPSSEGPSGGPVDLDQTSAEVFPGMASLAVSPLNGNLIWAGSDDGLVWVTTDGGGHWQSVTPPALPQWAQISSIEPSHVSTGTAYLSASRYMWDDFHPYLFETTDYGQHWAAITNGLPDDHYVFAIRQDPDDANLLFAGTKNTVYVSFDGGGQWRALTLNLPRVQVRDIAIDTRQGDVAIATHGRSFWILDNLAFLEQLTKGFPDASSAHVFAPQPAWLTQSYGKAAETRPGNGENPAFGATIFFNIPSSYDGRTPVTLSFSDAQGQLIRSFALHLKTKKEITRAQRDQMTPSQLKQIAQDKLTAITPGMNAFQWDLRYPDATEVKGFYPPIAAGGLGNDVGGPQVVPGHYAVVLDYGGEKMQQSFDVGLDPRLSATPQDLAARFALLLRIHTDLDMLNKMINDALAIRDQLANAVAAHRVSQAAAQTAMAGLNAEIANLVQLKMSSSEGNIMFEPKLRSHLAYLAADIEFAYVRPTEAQYAVADFLEAQAKTGEARLHAAMAAAKALM